MKTSILFILVILCLGANAQRATLENDTARFMGKIYTMNEILTLGNGSKPNKDFAFITQKSALSGQTNLPKDYADVKVVVDKIFKKGKFVFIRAISNSKTVDEGDNNRLFIDLEGALSSKELR